MNDETMIHADILITGGKVVTVDANGTCYEEGAVAVSGTTIVAVGQALDLADVRARERIDARGKLIMPGLVNAHNHMPMSLFRGLADDLPLEQWLQEHIFPAEARFITPESVRLGARLSVAEMVLSGTTTCCDGYFLASDIADGVSQTGLRLVLGQGVIDFPAPGVPDPAHNIDVAEGFVREWRDRSPLIMPSIFCHAPYTCSPETLQAAKAAADKWGVLFQIHVAETRSEEDRCRQAHGCSSVQYLERLGLLDRRTLLIHSIWVDETDLDFIARRQAPVVHCPESNMKLASGIAPVPGMIERGIVVGLGSDGCASNNDLDLFNEMDTTAKLHKVHHSDPAVLNAAKVVHMATMGGAQALSLEHKIGSLEQGKEADLIVIDAARPHLTPMYQPQSHIVYAVKGSDVQDVMIAGRWVVRDHRTLTLDTDAIMEEAARLGAVIGKGEGKGEKGAAKDERC
jgi:5-methylthioadenosine/S-adenosylhomocysteine deaminase